MSKPSPPTMMNGRRLAACVLAVLLLVQATVPLAAAAGEVVGEPKRSWHDRIVGALPTIVGGAAGIGFAAVGCVATVGIGCPAAIAGGFAVGTGATAGSQFLINSYNNRCDQYKEAAGACRSEDSCYKLENVASCAFQSESLIQNWNEMEEDPLSWEAAGVVLELGLSALPGTGAGLKGASKVFGGIGTSAVEAAAAKNVNAQLLKNTLANKGSATAFSKPTLNAMQNTVKWAPTQSKALNAAGNVFGKNSKGQANWFGKSTSWLAEKTSVLPIPKNGVKPPSKLVSSWGKFQPASKNWFTAGAKTGVVTGFHTVKPAIPKLFVPAWQTWQNPELEAERTPPSPENCNSVANSDGNLQCKGTGDPVVDGVSITLVPENGSKEPQNEALHISGIARATDGHFLKQAIVHVDGKMVKSIEVPQVEYRAEGEYVACSMPAGSHSFTMTVLTDENKQVQVTSTFEVVASSKCTDAGGSGNGGTSTQTSECGAQWMYCLDSDGDGQVDSSCDMWCRMMNKEVSDKEDSGWAWVPNVWFIALTALALAAFGIAWGMGYAWAATGIAATLIVGLLGFAVKAMIHKPAIGFLALVLVPLVVYIVYRNRLSVEG